MDSPLLSDTVVACLLNDGVTLFVRLADWLKAFAVGCVDYVHYCIFSLDWLCDLGPRPNRKNGSNRDRYA